VTARSPTDPEQANPAFLRFVVDGVDIEISGGEKLDTLVEIAETMVSQ
jgi:hypothetical protein